MMQTIGDYRKHPLKPRNIFNMDELLWVILHIWGGTHRCSPPAAPPRPHRVQTQRPDAMQVNCPSQNPKCVDNNGQPIGVSVCGLNGDVSLLD